MDTGRLQSLSLRQAVHMQTRKSNFFSSASSRLVPPISNHLSSHIFPLTPHPFHLSLHFTAYGFTGEPTAPVIGSAGATNMNS